MQRKKLSACAILLLITGCSTIIEGRNQQITINTNPADAKCTLNRLDTPIGSVANTPGSVLIEKTKYDIKIICSKDGYQDATCLNHSGSAGATFGNIAAGGLIGWGVDSATGADNKYDSPVNITLAPDEDDQIKKKSKKKHKNEDDQ